MPTSPAAPGDAVPDDATIAVGQTANFRMVTGQKVARGRLYRSAALDRLGDDGRDALQALGLERVLDLRSRAEGEHAPDDLGDPPVVPLVLVPFEVGAPTDAAGRPGGLEDVYRTIVDQNGAEIALALRALAESPGPALVHCTAGKDRTGLVVAFAQALAGEDDDTVVAGYAQSQDNLAGPWADAMLDAVRRAGIDVDASLERIITQSPPEVLRDTIEHVREAWGSVPTYLEAQGFDAADQEALVAWVTAPVGSAPSDSIR